MAYDYLVFCWTMYLADWFLWIAIPFGIYVACRKRQFKTSRENFNQWVRFFALIGWCLITYFAVVHGKGDY